MNTEEILIEKYAMERLPIEGTFVKKIYESELIQCDKKAASAMIGLNSKRLKSYSMMHRLNSDEIWFFLEGSSLELITIDEKKQLKTVILGSDFQKDELSYYVVKAGVWQAAKTMGDYTLYSCMVVPAFEPRFFEGADKSLLDKYPEYFEKLKDLIPESKYLASEYKG